MQPVALKQQRFPALLTMKIKATGRLFEEGDQDYFGRDLFFKAESISASNCEPQVSKAKLLGWSAATLISSRFRC